MDKWIRHIKEKVYLPGVTIITPSGDRPVCIDRLMRQLSWQTHFKDNDNIQWILVDDGTEKYVLNPEVEGFCLHIYRGRVDNDKAISFNNNVEESTKHVKYDKILIMEDDDWYSPKYIEKQVERLKNCDLAGEGMARYYRVDTREWHINGNTKSASLCQTILRASILDVLYVCCQRKTSAFIDGRLWDKDVKKKVFCDTAYCIGIKGMPGRKGIGMGHRQMRGYRPDPNLTKLAEWIDPESIEFYSQFYGGK